MEGSRGCDAAESWLMHQVLMGVVAQGRAGIGTSTSPCYNKTQGDSRCVHQWKMSEPAGQLQCESREPGQDGSKQWKTRSHRLHCGRLCPSASNPLTRLSTMFYQGHSICSAGGKWSQELASCAQRQGLLSTSSAAV